MVHIMAYRATAFTENRKAQTRSRLLKEATRLVSRAGFRGLSIAQVASASGVATGTVYRYFPSKSELCIAVFEQATQREIDAVKAASRLPRPPLQQLEQAFDCFIQRALKNPHLAYALIAEPVDPGLEQTRLVYRGRWAETFAQLIQQGIDQGALAQQPAHLVGTALVGAMAETVIIPLQQARHEAGNHTPVTQAHCRQIIDFCRHAVLQTEPSS
ncbi:MAG: TetR family transcriptional regulator [Pseudomonadales bacterium]|nr:TetR family transcriptional regulator [Pseudomonadales bacterium]